jgi:hypothetical protein
MNLDLDRILPVLPLAVFLAAAPPGWAQSSAPSSTPSSGQSTDIIQPDTPAAEALETTRETVRETVDYLARRVDSWFGAVPFDEGGGKIQGGQLNLELNHNENSTTRLGVRFKANVRLPNLEKRAYAFIGQDDPHSVVSDQPDDLTRANRLLAQQRRDGQFFAGLGRAITDRFDVRAGVHGPLRPFVQARANQRWTLSKQEAIDFRETVFVTIADKIGSTTAVQYERAFSRAFALRYLTSMTVTHADPYFKWSSILGVYKDFGAQRAATLEGIVDGTVHHEVPITDYGVQGTWEQPIYQDWMLAQLLVGKFWPRADLTVLRSGRWVAGLYLKMKF